MSHALILQNVSREGPGLLAEALRLKNFTVEICDLDAGGPIPPLEGFNLLIVLGGPDSANDQNVKIQQELGLIRDWIHSDKPYLGICLGLQMMVKAAGGRVVKAVQKELGFHDPEGLVYELLLTPDGRKDPLFNGLAEPIPVFQLHGETVELTPDMALLARGVHCQNQVVRYKRNVYGIQCHIEVTKDLLSVWADEDEDLRNMPRQKLLDHYAVIKGPYQETGLKLLSNFLDAVMTTRVEAENESR